MFHTPNVQVTGARVSSGGVERGVLTASSALTLVMEVFVDRSLYGQGFRTAADFRIIRATDYHVFNHFWNGMLDTDFDFGGENFWMSLTWDQPEDAGAGGGLYIFHPFFVVDANEYSRQLFRATGRSEFGVLEIVVAR